MQPDPVVRGLIYENPSLLLMYENPGMLLMYKNPGMLRMYKNPNHTACMFQTG